MTTAPNPEPRLMTQKQAAAYCGVTVTTFAKWVANGVMPPALPVMRRWDRKAIDAHLDKVSGLDMGKEQEDPFLAWEREYEAQKRREAGLSPKQVQDLRDAERAAARRAARGEK